MPISYPPCAHGFSAAIVLAALAGATTAQLGAGSENYALLTPEIGFDAGRLESGSYSAEVAGAGHQVGAISSAGHQAVLVSTAAPTELAAAGAPILFGAQAKLLDPAGGEMIELMGLRFGSDPMEFEIDGTSAFSISASATVASILSPAGADPFGNARGEVLVTVKDADGTSRGPRALTYGPALTTERPSGAGQQSVLRLDVAPGRPAIAMLGLATPGVALPISGIVGALEPLTYLDVLLSVPSVPDGVLRFSLPESLSAVAPGATVQVQAIQIDSYLPLIGSFTDAIDVTIAP